MRSCKIYIVSIGGLLIALISTVYLNLNNTNSLTSRHFLQDIIFILHSVFDRKYVFKNSKDGMGDHPRWMSDDVCNPTGRR